ncbi:hypothetical protein D9M73_191950 [compost metagenome]
MVLSLSALGPSLMNKGTSSRVLIVLLMAKLPSNVPSVDISLRAVPSWLRTRCRPPCRYSRRVLSVAVTLRSKAGSAPWNRSVIASGCCWIAQ